MVNIWWARRDLNPQPDRYERTALTIELQAHHASKGGFLPPCGNYVPYVSRKLRNLREREGCFSLRRALASI